MVFQRAARWIDGWLTSYRHTRGVWSGFHPRTPPGEGTSKSRPRRSRRTSLMSVDRGRVAGGSPGRKQ